jgi:hypothetical protein
MTATTERLDAITARLDAATPGPWRTWKDDGGRRGSAVETAWAHDVDGSDTELITDWCSVADAEFIADARTDIPFLLDLARKQAAALEAALALAEEWRYKGEFGWGAWQEGHGPDPEGYALDGASADLRTAIGDALEATP